MGIVGCWFQRTLKQLEWEQTDRQTHRTTTVTLAHARRGLISQTFSTLLKTRALLFQDNNKYTLELGELEKQEMKNFLKSSIDCCTEFPSLCLEVLRVLEVSIESQFLFSFYDKDSLVHLVKSTLVKLSPGGKTARGDAEPRKDVEKCGKPDQVRCQYVHRKVCQVSVLPAVSGGSDDISWHVDYWGSPCDSRHSDWGTSVTGSPLNRFTYVCT